MDSHAHAVPAALLEDLRRRPERFPHVEVIPWAAGTGRTDDPGSFVVRFADREPTRPIPQGLLSPERRSRWMREQGVDVQVIAGWVDLFGYSLAADEGAEWARLMSARLADLAASSDGRLIALGTVPLQDPRRAADALRESRDAGMPGIMIATRSGDLELDDPAFTPLWEAADALGAVVYLHPGYGGAGARYAKFGLLNGLGRIEDGTVTVARLLYAGVPARFPGMKLIIAHGGGALPYVLGRLVRNHLISDGTVADPLESFAHLYFDTVVFDPPALRLLIERAGAGRILLGSDYPFPIGDPAPRTVVERVEIADEDRGRILGGTAARLFGAPVRTGAP